MSERFDDKFRGQRIKVDEWNRATDAIERADGLRAAGAASISNRGGSKSITVPDNSPFALVRMTADCVIQEASRSSRRGGELPAVFNAVLQTWDNRANRWVDKEGSYLWVDNPCAVPLNKEDYVLVFVERTSGRHVATPYSNVQLAVTVADPNLTGTGEDSGSGSGGGFYPPEIDEPTTYCIDFVTVPYPPIPGRNVLPEDAGAVGAGEIAPSTLGPSSRPHATVMNLYQGSGAYIPEGTILWCFLVGGQWYTYTLPPGAAAETPVFAKATELLFTEAASGSDPIVYDACGRALAVLLTGKDPCAYGEGEEIVVAPLSGSLYPDRRYRVWRMPGVSVVVEEASPAAAAGSELQAAAAGTHPLYVAEGETRKEVLTDSACVGGIIVNVTTYVYSRGGP